MRFALLILFAIGLSGVSWGQQRDSVEAVLSAVLAKAESFEEQKQADIQIVQTELARAGADWKKRYAAQEQLYYAYQKFQIDSAARYAKDNVTLARRLQQPDEEQKSLLQLSMVLSAGGKFVEAKEILQGIEERGIAASLLSDYYRAMLNFYSHYGLSSNNRAYFQESELYRDSMLMTMDARTLDYEIAWLTKEVYGKRYELAKPRLLHLCDSLKDNHQDRGLVAYLLGLIYRDAGDMDKQTTYFAISGIADIKNGIRDNASMQSLALSYYEQGDVDQAHLYLDRAMQDAIFSKVRFRTIESATFYPIIHAAFIEKERHQQTQLIRMLGAISLPSLLSLGGVWFTYRQMLRLRRVREALDKTNAQLHGLNAELQSSNTRLLESDHIKEAYIAQFFDICSSYIHKMDSMRKDMLKKVLQQDLDGLKRDLQSSGNLKHELEDLYTNFDIIFIHLYPTFVSDFNGLLLPDEQIVLKDGEHLNSELRIYALIRLGISDNAKIAGFLRYSLRTVYNYRVKTRNKVRGDKDEFEKSLMQLGTKAAPLPPGQD